jgi:hypothetical protein
VLYVDFQSKFDWNSERDILCRNPNFHQHPRYDSIIYEADGNDLAMGQLEVVFRCHLPRQISLDLAMIRPYRDSSWTAKTRTDCPIREWGAGPLFITLEQVTRGALLCPILGASRNVFYVMDGIDSGCNKIYGLVCPKSPLCSLCQLVMTRNPPREWLVSHHNTSLAHNPAHAVAAQTVFFRHGYQSGLKNPDSGVSRRRQRVTKVGQREVEARRNRKSHLYVYNSNRSSCRTSTLSHHYFPRTRRWRSKCVLLHILFPFNVSD